MSFVDLVQRLAGGVVDVLLVLLHPGDILRQGDGLLRPGGVEQQQVLQQVLVGAVFRRHAVLELPAEVLPEFLVALPVVLEHLGKLALDLLLQIGGDHLQLPVVLQQLPGDVQAQVRRVHHAPDEPEVLRQQVRALVHDEDPVGVQLEALFVLLGVVVEGGGAGDEQQRLVGDGALGGHGDDLLGVGVVVELVPVELVVLLRLHTGLAALPDGHHGVEGLLLGVGLVFGLVVGRALLPAGLGDLHPDGEADVVGVLAHQLLEPPGLQELAVLLVVGIRLEVHDDVRAHGWALTLGDGVAVGAGGLPHIRGLRAVLPRHHGDVVRHHEGGVEAHAELADDVGVLGVVPHLLLELEGAGGGDDAQVVLQVLPVHADAVVGDGQGPALPVRLDLDLEVLAAHAHGVVRQGLVAQLVAGVAGVGDDLPEEDLLVGVDGVDHQVQQPLGLRLELFLCHDTALPLGVFLQRTQYSTLNKTNK